MGNEASLTPQTGIEVIDQWLSPLSVSERTQLIADELDKLKSLLASVPTNPGAIVEQMQKVAAKVSRIAPELGAKGEMPSLLTASATALRMGIDLSSRTAKLVGPHIQIYQICQFK